MQRHGGEVRLWSRLGSGSTFTIRLPRVEEDPASARKPKRKLRGETAKDKRPVRQAARVKEEDTV